MESTTPIELLAPAKNLACGIAAINYGADAVYIGAPKFSARSAAGNPLADIEKLIRHAHKYWAKVYAALNTLLFDNELDEARSIVQSLYNAGVDGLIIQDMGLLEIDLPPIPLIASTQTHNYDLAKIQFLERVGFKRIILARELSLRQIEEIRAKTSLELEFFVHGALCVCYSGQCYLSEATQGRSANRGECAQPCRFPYTLTDASGTVIAGDKYLLSLKDLNLSGEIPCLLDAGITSFKIEGRLKDIHYVKNITAFYRQHIDRAIAGLQYSRSSSGTTNIHFQPDPEKSFNRGFTKHFLFKRSKDNLSIDSPKSIGAYIGKVVFIGRDYIMLDNNDLLHNGDGLCFFDPRQELCGTKINQCAGDKVYPDELDGIAVGSEIFRNYDHGFSRQLQSDKTQRAIRVQCTFEEIHSGYHVKVVDEDSNEAFCDIAYEKNAPKNPEAIQAMIEKQLAKSGDTIFCVTDVAVRVGNPVFFPVSLMNKARRDVLAQLEKKRMENYPRTGETIQKNNSPYPRKKLDYRANIVNKKAEAFYVRHGAEEIQPGLELLHEYDEKVLMTMKHCLRFQFGMCTGREGSGEPLYLSDFKNRYCLEFDCQACEMKVLLDRNAERR